MTTVSFSATGTHTTFVVPTGITSLDIDIVGGNGGPPWAVGTPPVAAGRGTRLQATITVIPGETLTLQVGEAGRYSANAGVNGDRIGGTGSDPLVTGLGGYPDGGAGGKSGITGSFYAGGGGGSTRIWRGGIGGTLLAIVAAGGGIGFIDGTVEGGSPTVTGNGGQPSPGQNGRNVDISGTTLLNPGIGATSSAGGAAGLGASPGASLAGGDGAPYVLSPFQYSGGGGGGGLFGGGGGGRELLSARRMGSQGGGGSSYVIPGATSVVWSINANAATGGTSEDLYIVQAGGSITLTYVEETTPVGWSLGLVKMLG